jgi:hypothetical protein
MTNILKKLDASFRKLFASEPKPAPETEAIPEPEDGMPPHLVPLPAEEVHKLCDAIADELDPLSFGTVLELRAAQKTRTPHDLRRLAFALRFVMRRGDLADQIETLLSEQWRVP